MRVLRGLLSSARRCWQTLAIARHQTTRVLAFVGPQLPTGVQMNKDYQRKRYNLRFKSYLVLLFAMMLTGVPGLGTAQSLTYPAPIGIENFGKLNDNYYRGSQPNADQFGELKRLGVKTVVDLRKDRLGEASEWARAAGLQYINIPLTTKRPATQEQTAQFLYS